MAVLALVLPFANDVVESDDARHVTVRIPIRRHASERVVAVDQDGVVGPTALEQVLCGQRATVAEHA